jgi:DNA-binding NarL/FixJ family response regulator
VQASAVPFAERSRVRSLSPLMSAGSVPLTRPVPAEPARRRSRLLIGVERRAFFHGCLSLWLGRFCQEYGASVVTDLQAATGATGLDQAVAVIIGVGEPASDADWLGEQISWLRNQRPNLPVALIVDDAYHEGAETLVGRFGLQGYIPTSTSVEVAAAAARLIVAGGSYFPRAARDTRAALPPQPMEAELAPNPPGAAEKLTPREDAVLELLGRGTPNKIIAYRLGISLSTAKVHVHNIIKKLNAHNRTEVALVARQLRHRATPRVEGDA